jgi:hypothetical protein
VADMLISFHRSRDAQQKNHASGAKFNVFRDILVLADGMALKAVIFGSLMVALLV